MEYNKYIVTCSIVTYKNDLFVLEKAIRSFLGTSLEVRLYIIDNSPSREIMSLCDDERIEYIFTADNVGFGAGHNIILAASEKLGRYHLVMNPDVYYHDRVIEELLEYMEENQGVGIVMPRILYPDGKHQFLPKLYPRPLDLFVRRFPFPAAIKDQVNERYELRFANYTLPFEVSVVSGCFSFIRSSVIRNGIKYDERFFMYFEDFDLSRRIEETHRAVCYPLVSIYHEYARGAYADIKLLKIFICSLIKYFNKWGWIFDKKRQSVNRTILEQCK